MLVGLGACTSAMPDDAGPGMVAAGSAVTTPHLDPQAYGDKPAPAKSPGEPPSALARSVTAAVKPPTVRGPSAPPGSGLEEIVVTARDLSGFWTITGPKNVEIHTGLFSGVQIKYSTAVYDRNICVVHDRAGRLTAKCSAGVDRPASGTFDGTRMALHWWAGPGTILFNGTWDGADTIRGAISGGLLGISVTGDIPMSLTKIDPVATGAAPPVSAAMMRAVFDDLQRRTLTPGRYEPHAAEHLRTTLARPAPLAPLQGLTYLGTVHVRWRKTQPETIQDVYAVQSAAGEQLCRIAVIDTGRVADFDCRGTQM